MLCGYTPDAWQVEALTSTSKRLALNCPRQSGKSTCSSIAASHMAVHKAGSVQLLISPSQRQSAELLEKVLGVLRRYPATPRIVEESKHAVRLANGSRIVSLPASEDTVRGYSAVDRIIEDEAAFCDDGLYRAILPMLAVSGGALWMLSTPNGRRGHFFEAWEHGGSRWHRIRVSAENVPRIPREALEEARAVMGAQYAQEYEGQFIDAATGRVYHAFDAGLHCIDAAPALTHYLLGIDYGVVDATAFTVLGWREHDPCVYVVQSYRMNGTSPSDAAEEAKRLEATYAFVKIAGDVGGMGKGFAVEGARRYQLPVEAAQKHNKAGYIALLNGELARGNVKVVRAGCADLIEEWQTLPWAEGRQKEAPGYQNHAADSCLYAWRAASAFAERPVETPKAKSEEEAFREAEARMLALEEAQAERPWWDQ